MAAVGVHCGEGWGWLLGAAVAGGAFLAYVIPELVFLATLIPLIGESKDSPLRE